MITATRTAAQHLQTVIDRWADLTDALATRQQTTWPPTMGVTRLVHDLEADEHTHTQRIVTRRLDDGRTTYECASCNHVGDGNGHPVRPDRDQPGPGASPAPISVDILDTMRTVESELVHCADVIASQIQRPAMNHAPRGAGWTEAEIAQVRAVHRRVRGRAPDGRPYSASDPHLLSWVHLAEVEMFLHAYQRHGAGRLTPAEAAAQAAANDDNG